MKGQSKKAASIFIFFSILISSAFLFASCDFFSSLSTQSENADGCKIVIRPQFSDNSQSLKNSSRSAYPDFDSLSFASGYTFKATSEILTEDATGTYDEDNKTIVYSIVSDTFSNKNFTFYICDSEGKELFSGSQKISYATQGTAIEKNVYFKSYDSSTVKGYIDLSISVSENYNIKCSIVDSAGSGVSGASGDGKPVIITSSGTSCTIKTVEGSSGGIAAGEYTANIYIYRDGDTTQARDYIQQTIYVWPKLTTSKWYLSDGSKESEYPVTISEDFVKFWVKGDEAGGPYAAGGVTLDSSSRQGSILNPFTSVTTALGKCTSSTTDYRIVVCGAVTDAVTVNESVAAKTITIEGVNSFETDSIKTPSGINNEVILLKRAEITIKNLLISSNGQAAGIHIYNVSSGEINVEGCKVYQNSGGGGISLYGSSCLVKIKNCDISHNYSNGYGGGINPCGNSTIEIEDTTISYNNCNTCGGGIYVPLDCTVSFKNGIISNNSSAVEPGGAVGIQQGYFEISGSVYIPYGVDGELGKGKNDIHNRVTLADSIIIKGKLTPPEESGGIVGYIKPCYYNTTCPVLITLDSSVTDTTLKRELKKFVIVQDPANPDTTWAFTSTGKLQEGVPFSYPETSTSTFDGAATISVSGHSSAVFIEGRKLGQIKGIIASDHETTQGEYETYCKYGGDTPTTGIGKGDFYPVYSVSWYDAIVYCNLRSIDEGLEPVYVVNEKTNPAQWPNIEGSLTEGYCAPESCSWNVTILGNKNGWRLPFEVEWEFLARDGNLDSVGQTIYSGSDTITDVANCPASGNGKTLPVKSLSPTSNLHMYDMSGNVWEWVSDLHINRTEAPYIYADTPSSGVSADSTNNSRVTKGGGYSGNNEWCEAKHRNCSTPNSRNNDMGFRVVRGGQYAGSKIPSVAKAVGDIAFNDGSAMPSTEFAKLDAAGKNQLKDYAIAMIFYKGTGLNSGSNTASRTLGFGLKHSLTYAWCAEGAKAYDKKITTIQCPYGGTAGAMTFDSDADKDGSDNLAQIASFLGNSDNDTGTAGKYPAFYYGDKYKDLYGSNVSGTIYESGWYLPTLAELFQIYANGIGSSKVFDLETTVSGLGGDTFTDNAHRYCWSSSQYDGDSNIHAYLFDFQSGFMDLSPKHMDDNTICCIREF